MGNSTKRWIKIIKLPENDQINRKTFDLTTYFLAKPEGLTTWDFYLLDWLNFQYKQIVGVRFWVGHCIYVIHIVSRWRTLYCWTCIWLKLIAISSAIFRSFTNLILLVQSRILERCEQKCNTKQELFQLK